MKTLEELFLDELADIYDAEGRLTHALPKMARAAEAEELREAFAMHLEETEEQVEKLQKVFRFFDKNAAAKKCDAMVGLLKEADKIVSDNEGSPTIDAALIAAAQKIEHYEIASYGCLREWAEQLGNNDAALLLETILNEEKAADTKLTELARQVCNQSAQENDDEEGAPSGRAMRPARAHARRTDSE